MRRALTAAGAFAGLATALAVLSQSAGAIPLAKSPAAPQGVVDLAGHGGHGHGGGGGPHMHGGGGGHWHGGGGGHWHGGGGHGIRFYGGPRFRGYFPYYGYGAYSDYYYDDYAGDDCSWLRRRAQATGSRYWWNRYRACIDD